MENPDIRIIETSIALITYFLIRLIINKSVDRTIIKTLVQKTRGKLIKKALHLVLLATVSIVILIIWGVDQSELMLFIGSVLTVIGIALFAQWSILSNITSGVILFFNHPVKLDDTIVIMDKDFHIEGKVSDIGLFFVRLTTHEGNVITIPSNVFIQKMIQKKSN